MGYDEYAESGVIYFDRLRDSVGEARSLRRDAQRGQLIKLRRGAYVTPETWSSATGTERHLLRARATLAALKRPVALAGISAAAVWGMPVNEEWPDEVTVLDEWRGGGRSEPGVKRTAAGFASAEIVVVEGMPVTTIARTALDVARTHTFATAIGTLDWTLWRRRPGALDKSDLTDELWRMARRNRPRHLERCIQFATHLSDSFGESKARAVMHTLGFEAPELQVEFHDAEGAIYPDYFWRSVMVAGEFDGKAKYTRDEYAAGDPSEVVWREKKREDRLRRMCSGVTRIVTADVERPSRLERLLIAAGVPRGRT